MSRVEIYAVNQNGEVGFYSEARNAWGGAMHIWQSLAKKHLGGEFSIFSDLKPVWDLARNNSIPVYERVVLGSTFDNVIVRKEMLSQLIDAFEKFAEEFPTPTLQTEIEILKRMSEDEDVTGVCWNQTSVNSSPWEEWDEEQDDSIPYNINTGQKHWFLDDADAKILA